ncbi:MAG: hypothetical protein ABW061_18665 [Polyangiaceae bacterium]
MRRLLCFTLLLLATGCPSRAEHHGSALPPCSKFGDSCEFLPGKLGSCVVKDGCTGNGSECFSCQSQH